MYSPVTHYVCRCPADLVMSFEIVEMHQEYLDRLKIKKIHNHLAANKGEHAMYDISFDAPEEEEEDEGEALWRKIKTHTIEILTQNIRTKIEAVFQSVERGDGLEVTDRDENGVFPEAKVMLVAGKRILEIMAIYNHEVVPCMPPEYKALEIFLVAVEDFLLSQVMSAVTSLGRENHFIFNLINFLERFVAQVEAFGLPGHYVCRKFRWLFHQLHIFDNIRRIWNAVDFKLFHIHYVLQGNVILLIHVSHQHRHQFHCYYNHHHYSCEL